MTIIGDYGPLNPDALVTVESRSGSLPEDYRSFILTHNGVVFFDTAVVRVDTPDGPNYWPIKGIHGFAEDPRGEVPHPDAEFWPHVFPKGILPIATDGRGNTYVLLVGGNAQGEVRFLDCDRWMQSGQLIEELPCLATSFSEFLSRIHDFDPNDPESAKRCQVPYEDLIAKAKAETKIAPSKKPWWRFW